MEDNRFETLPTHSSIGEAAAEESAKFGTIASSGLGSFNTYSPSLSLDYNATRSLPGSPLDGVLGGIVGYDPKSRNIDRYKDNPAYQRLGFSVLRDNEEYYNANTTWLDDARRAFKWHNWGAGFMQGLSSNYEGLKTIGGGNFINPAAIDRKKGILAEEAAARAMSTRGGFGQSAINIPYNLNYTLGIVTSIVAEDLLLAAAAPATFGGSLAYGAYRTVKGGARAIKSLYQTVKTADNIKDVVKLKDIYSGTKAGLGALGQAFVPNTGKLTYGAYQASTKATTLGKTGDALKDLFSIRGFGAGYRDFRMISLAVDESNVEAAGVRNQLEDKLIRQYVQSEGSLPQGEAMRKIMQTAQDASVKDYFANLPVIYATNAITFNSLTLPYSLTGNTLRVASARGQHLFAKAVGTKVEAEILSTRQLIGKAFTNKQYRKYALGTAFNYMKGNISEGFQELYQEGTSAALEDYYTNKYFTPEGLAGKAINLSIKKGLEDQISQQGLEAFLGGFLGGAGVQGVAGGVQQLRVGAAVLGGKFSSDFREEYQKRRDQDIQSLKNMEASILLHSDNVLAALAPEFANFKVQTDGSKALLDAAELNDRKAFEDIKDDSLFNHIVRLSAMGVTDSFIEAMENHKLLSEEEMMQALNVQSKEEGDKLVDDIVKRTRSIAKTAMVIENRYQNPYAGLIFDMTKEPSERKRAMISYMAFEEAKKDFIFSYYKSGRNLDRLDEIYNAAVEDAAVAGMTNIDFSVLFSTKSGRADKEGRRLYEQALEAEIDKLTSDITAAETLLDNIENSEETPEKKADQKRVAQEQLSKATKKKALLENYSKAIATILESKNVEETMKDPKVLAEFEKAVDEYLDFLGANTSSIVDKEKTAKLKNQLLDYFRLSEDRVTFNAAASALSDPAQFQRWYDVHKAQLEAAYEKYLREGLDRAKEAVEKEHRLQLIEELEKIDVVISAEPERDEEGNITRESPLDRFIQLGDVPTKFFSTNEKDTDINGNVIEGSETWNKIQDIIDKYALLDEEFAQDLENLRNKEAEVEEEAVPEVTPETPPGSTQVPPQEDEEEVTEPKKRINDNQIPVKREVIRVTDEYGEYTEYTVITYLDGSLQADAVQYDEKGNKVNTIIGAKIGDNDIIKRDGLTALDAVKLSVGKGMVVTVESTQSGTEFINPKMLDKLTPEQRKRFEEKTQDPENAPATTTTDNVYSIEELEKEFANVVYNGKKGGLIQALQKMFRKANAELAQEERFTNIDDWINGEGKIEVEPIILRLREAVAETTVEPVETTPDVAFEEPVEPAKEQPKRKGRTLSQRLASLSKTKNVETIQKQKEKAANELSTEESTTFMEAANARIQELEAAEAKTTRQEEMNFEPADVEVSDKEFGDEATKAFKNAKEGGEITEEDDDIDIGCK